MYSRRYVVGEAMQLAVNASLLSRAVGRSQNQEGGGHVVMWWA